MVEGANITGQQKERWSGQYPLSVLDEAMRKIAVRLGASTAPELAKLYPALPLRGALEEVLRDIGVKTLGFETIRKPSPDFAIAYGIPLVMRPSGGSGTGTGPAGGGGSGGASASGSAGAGSGNASSGSGTGGTSGGGISGPKAHPANDPKFVTATLKAFIPHGPNRQKVVVLRDEALKLKLKDNPVAFCFLLRSMFEISARAYCKDHQSEPTLALTNAAGKDKTLAELLSAIALHIAGGKLSTPMGKTLHGAQTELARKDGILSVTSMNALVHSPIFLVGSNDICILFGNVYPLLEAMN